MSATPQVPPTPRFHVKVKRLSETIAHAEAHGKTLELAIKGGDPALGFTAPETLLAAFGACILSNISRLAAQSGLQREDAEVVFDGVKHTDPLGIDQLRYRVDSTAQTLRRPSRSCTARPPRTAPRPMRSSTG